MREMDDEIRKDLEKFRIMGGSLASNSTYGNNGAFIVRGPNNKHLHIIVSDGEGWEHVSVSVEADTVEGRRLPDWNEMNFVKDLFWRDEETVVQFHPKKSRYVNVNPFVLHLWRQKNSHYVLPPNYMIG